MANHKSALKRHKQSLQRASRNRAARTRVKNAVKQVRVALQGNDQGPGRRGPGGRYFCAVQGRRQGRSALEKGRAQDFASGPRR